MYCENNYYTLNKFEIIDINLLVIWLFALYQVAPKPLQHID